MPVPRTKFRLYLLGPPRVETDGNGLSLPTQKAEALLAFLAINETWHSRERLATFLWGDSDDKHARSSLRNALYLLRNHLAEDAFLMDRNYVAIQPASFWVDFKHLENTVKNPFIDVDTLRDALDLWRAPFLDGVTFSGLLSFDEWLSRERERSHLFYRDGWMLLCKLLIAQGKQDQALDAARHLVFLDPLSEPAHRYLMRLYLMKGDRVAALKQFDYLETRLKDELGVEPGEDTTALQRKALRVEAWLPNASTPISITPPSTTLVGRGDELEKLSAQWRAVLPVGPARMTLLTGEPGIGKTSLVTAWKETLNFPLLLHARSFDPQQNTTYDLWVQLLKASYDEIGLDKIHLSNRWMGELANLLPEIYRQHPELPRSLYNDSEIARGRIMEAIYQWAVALTQNQPVCFFIDDLQWSDQASLQALAYLLQNGGDLPLFIVGAQRSGETRESWRETAGMLKRMGLLHRIQLNRLSFDEVSILISMLGLTSKDPIAFLQRIYQETAGNPLFVIEMAQALQKVDLESATEFPIPSTIQGVIRARLSRLSEETRHLLELASLLAQNFSSAFLKVAGDISFDAVNKGLNEALKMNILVEQAGESYQFSHNKISDVLAADLLPEKSRYLHKRIAESLEKEFINGESIEVERISYHYEKANQLTLSVEYALRAAKRAVELYVDEDALTWYERAFNLLVDQDISLAPEKVRGLSPFEQIEISENLPFDVLGLVFRQRGLIAQRTGNYTHAEDHFHSALTRAKQRHRIDEQGAAHNLLSFLAYLRSDYPLVEKHAQYTLDFGIQANVAHLQAAGLRNLGIAAYHSQKFDRALALYQEARLVYEEVTNKVGIATCYNNIGFALRTLRRYEEAILFFEKAFSYYEAAGQVEGQALILANIGRAYASQGDSGNALDHLDRAQQLSTEIHTDWITVKIWRTKGRVFAQNGRWKEALDAAYKAQDLAETLGSDEDLGVVYCLLGEIAAWGESNLGSPEEYFKQSIFLLEKVGEQHEIQRSLDSFENYKKSIKK